MHVYRGKISWSDKFQNEAVTILFPSDITPGAQVLLFSQWSNIPDGLESKSFSAHGVVVEPSKNSSATTLSLSHATGSIDLSVTRLGNDNIVLRLGGSMISEDLATISLVYQSSIYSRAYTGTFNEEISVNGEVHRAVDETVLAIIADEENGFEKLLCVFWQWTATPTTTKANANFLSSSPDNIDFISFSEGNDTATVKDLVDGDFTFLLRKGTDEQDSQVLSVLIAGTPLKSEVVLRSFAPRFTIRNDTGTFINVELTTAQPLTDDIFTYGGYNLAALGILFAFASTGIGLYFAIGSYLLSNLPVVWNSWGSTVREARYTGFAPGSSVTVDVPDEMHLFVTRVRQAGRSIIVEYAQQKFTQAATVDIDNSWPWKQMINFGDVVPIGKQLFVKGLLQLPNVRASMVGIDTGDGNNNVNLGIYTSDEKSSKASYHRAFNNDSDANLTLLEYTKGHNCSIAITSEGSADFKLIRSLSDLYTPSIILMFRYATAEVDSSHSYTIGGNIGVPGENIIRANFEASLWLAIKNNRSNSLYWFVKNSHTPTLGNLYCLKGDSDIPWSIKSLKRKDNPDAYIFLRFTKPVVLSPTYIMA